MAPYCTGNYPRMFVKKQNVIERKKWLNKNKSIPLSIEFKKQIFHDAVYDISSFTDLCNIIIKVEAVRTYIARYPNDSTDLNVPNGFEGMLTLIYAPCNLNNTTGYYEDSNMYYHIHPFKGLIHINKAIALAWVMDYRNNILPILTEIVTTNGGKSISDTKSLLHKSTDIKELIIEIECQESSFIRASFTSYTNTEGPEINEEYKARLTVDFELIDKDGKVIYIEDRPRLKFEKNQMLFDFNNAELCPPLSCGGSSI